MRAEIVAIGTELTSGAKLDTNSQWLSLQLADLGVTTVFHTTVADDLPANIDVLRRACERVDLVIIGGGLGPTLDDLTREALAAVGGVELREDADALADLQQFFARRGKPMPERNRVQALFPIGAAILPNPVGTAPGIWMHVNRPDGSICYVAALPGVPSELHKMFLEQVRPRLPAAEMVIRRARINCFGIGESATEELLGELTARGRDPEIGITAHEATITLRIIAQAPSAADADAKIAGATAAIREKLGNYVFGAEDEELEHAVVREWNDRQQTFTTLECATGGLLAQKLAHVSGAEECFLSGSVKPTLREPVEAVATQLLEESQADAALVIGPEVLETAEGGRLTSTIQLALATSSRVDTQVLTWNGNPAITKAYAAKTALRWLLLAVVE